MCRRGPLWGAGSGGSAMGYAGGAPEGDVLRQGLGASLQLQLAAECEEERVAGCLPAHPLAGGQSVRMCQL